MTATWTTAARRLLLPTIASVAALGAPSVAEETDGSAPTACAVERCLTLGWRSDIADALAAGHALDIPDVAGGLTVTYDGEDALAVRLVAARYDRGRLVRYGVSERTVLEGPGEALALPGAEAVLAKAFAPAINRDVAVERVEHDLLQPHMQTPPERFVGEVPPTYLAANEERALFPMTDIAAEDVHELFDGSVGVVAILPDDDALRAPEALLTESALVRLVYESKDRDLPTG